jgi:hypothetical protein
MWLLPLWLWLAAADLVPHDPAALQHCQHSLNDSLGFFCQHDNVWAERKAIGLAQHKLNLEGTIDIWCGSWLSTMPALGRAACPSCPAGALSSGRCAVGPWVL